MEGGALGAYTLALHCGGCMIDAQKMRARLMDMQARGGGAGAGHGGVRVRRHLFAHLHTSPPLKRPPPPHPPQEAGVPVTNYGLFLSWVHDPVALARCLEPWGLSL